MPVEASAAGGYHETRHHTLRKTRMQMIDGALVLNARSVDAGTSVRVLHGGYWGLASAAGLADGGAVAALRDQAQRNAQVMARFGARPAKALPGGHHRGVHRFAGRTPLSPAECTERLGALHAWVRARYPGLRALRLMLLDEDHEKHITTAAGGDAQASIQRSALAITLVAEGADGAPVELVEFLSCKGSAADLRLDEATLGPVVAALHGHLQAKRHAVPARGGQHTVVLAPALAGILAHEAMGHPCEADIVLGGAVTANLLGQAVASPLITMLDVAHSFDGQEAMCPVYVDDEGTPATDTVLIERGVLGGFMHSRETAAHFGVAPTGSARAYAPADEPLIRMRNTVILPGESSLDALVAGVDDGYLLLKTANGQADSTTEFMFGIPLAYEIRGGRLGAAVRDTTLSGSAIQVLQGVDAVGHEMHWSCAGYCGKKQPMVVSMGGPALRTRAHLGGQ
ncbi:TldD/PmbA family protein [Aquabacterium sp. OR-4]|uniref:TldD/PmbA family protein n=1 Tax=Aquabacterium sp. OR-4 TaxID=2978127 RepID=UPI0021B3FC0F|nr:TldD/PmbA family protein [Aquabacterium sp. OR-4]MDT7835745.1 TldD/PmbA family protein [Aquabacterium sp. OR-4]